MAVTLAVKKRADMGNCRCVVFDVTGPASYTTGGELLTVGQLAALMPELGVPATAILGAAAVDRLFSENEIATFRNIGIDRAAAKILFLIGGAEVANATNLSAVVVRASILYNFGSNP